MKRIISPEAGFIVAIVFLVLSFLETDPVLTDLQRATGVVCLLVTSSRSGASAER